MRVIAVIPARGSSKSIPRKNIKSFLGHPLLAYSIAAAKACPLVDRIICTTDDEEIAQVARTYGAEVPFLRPAEISEDETTDFPVFLHIADFLGHALTDDDLLVHLRPTSPFRPPGLVSQGVEAMRIDGAADSVRAISLSGQNPFKMWTIEGDVITPLIKTDYHESYNMPRQLLPTTYWHNGLLDIVRVSCLKKQNSMSGTRILPIVVEPDYAIDLDTPHEWYLAEQRIKNTKLPYVKPD
jgi:N-acylneuraminate cytidylyltransferase